MKNINIKSLNTKKKKIRKIRKKCTQKINTAAKHETIIIIKETHLYFLNFIFITCVNFLFQPKIKCGEKGSSLQKIALTIELP